MIGIKNYESALEVNKFPDGTFRINVDITIFNNNNSFEINWFYEKEEEMVILFYLVSHIRNVKSNPIIVLNLPYTPNARMDRAENEDNVFTLKYFCNFINSLNFNKVYIVDPHSNVSEALLDRVVIARGAERIKQNIDKINNVLNDDSKQLVDMLFFPDEGAMKRYSKNCGTPFAFGIKRRDWATGEILNYEVNGDIPEGSNVLIVDDISSYGTTFYYAAKKLKEEYSAANVYLFVTHCENNILRGKLAETNYVDHVFTTKSIFTEKSDFVTII